MKNLIFILAIVLFSCEKDEPVFCWECELTTTYSATRYIPDVISNTYIKCDLTQDEIIEYMDDNSDIITIKIGSTIATTETKCVCKKK